MEFSVDYKSAYDRNQLRGTSSPAAQSEQSEKVSEYENDWFMNHHKTCISAAFACHTTQPFSCVFSVDVRENKCEIRFGKCWRLVS